MWPDRFTTRLRRLFGARARLDRHADRAKREALEQRLLAQHGQRYPAGPTLATPRSLALVGRLAVASVALAVAGIAACQIPVGVELELGRRVVFEVPADDPAEADARIEAVMQEFERRSNAESIELRVRHHGGETMQATLDVWGSALDLDAIEAVLDEHGFTANGNIEDLALAGTVRTTWGDRLGHDLFDLDLDLESMDVEQARQAILDQLDAQGFVGAEVEVESGEGMHRVEIRLPEPMPTARVGHTREPTP